MLNQSRVITESNVSNRYALNFFAQLNKMLNMSRCTVSISKKFVNKIIQYLGISCENLSKICTIFRTAHNPKVVRFFLAHPVVKIEMFCSVANENHCDLKQPQV